MSVAAPTRIASLRPPLQAERFSAGNWNSEREAILPLCGSSVQRCPALYPGQVHDRVREDVKGRGKPIGSRSVIQFVLDSTGVTPIVVRSTTGTTFACRAGQSEAL